ncbi:hypothetical protein GCM10007304_35830 [Rhodococcoides trifolii]|uniref:Transcriptional regulator, AbiEi antitoxin, Type IV TA system n=1 Tax=Rhodococcoides trifolii TaxID=908250 RepID=A0A917G1T0_9NOCA|nr:type IV toxin-antitoxin system AbiEi family antitoxin domain-containing protein [Rhodococcus trifolii]GGG18698.1 hypothetical protein GCM10007304_35830 [Rhodococcus trifolii]
MDDGDWQSVLDAQHGVVTTSQLAAFGRSPTAVKFHVDSGQWLRVFYGVIAVTNGPLSRAMHLQAALLYGGSGALLSHVTAAEEWGMRRAAVAGPVHITVRHGCSAVSQGEVARRSALRATSRSNRIVHPGVVVHRSRAIAHIGVEFDQPRTSKADTAIDLAVIEPTARGAIIRFVEAVTAGAIPIATMRAKLEVRPPRRYRRALHDALRMLADGVHSVLEHRYALDVERKHGLPSARRQAPHIVDGRTLFEDVDYTRSGVPLIVRLDGQGFHGARQIRFRDRRRDNAAELADRPRLTYGWDDVTGDPCAVYAEVREVLVREGWVDTSAPCGRCAPRV